MGTGLRLPRPTLLDRAISYVSPAQGLRRMHARTLLSLTGQYDGAKSDRRATQGWTPRVGSPDSDTVGDLPALRGRSRDLYRNAPLATGMIKTHTRSTIGWGLDPQPRLDRKILKLSEEEAREAQQIIKRFYWAWALNRCSDYADRFAFPRQTALTFQSRILSGDVWVVMHFDETRRRQRNELFALRLQTLEADRVSNPHRAPDTDTLIEGVELNPQTGEFQAIHASARHPGERFGYNVGPWTRIPVRGVRTGRPRVLHLMDPDGRPGLTRGIPLLAPVIENLRQISQLSSAVLMDALVSALFTAFIKTDGTGESGLSGVPGLVGQGPGTKPEHRDQIKMSPAGIVELNPGEEIEFANPMRPNANFEPFFKAFAQQFGVATGLPLELVLLHFTASFSASKAALQEAWRGFRMARSDHVADYCDPVYAMLVEEMVLRGYIRAPGFLEDPLIRMAWCSATWTGPAQGHLNPAQEATAMVTRMQARVTTLEQETAEYSGRDWEENVDQIAQEKRELATAGLLAETPTAAGALPPSPDSPEEDR